MGNKLRGVVIMTGYTEIAYILVGCTGVVYEDRRVPTHFYMWASELPHAWRHKGIHELKTKADAMVGLRYAHSARLTKRNSNLYSGSSPFPQV